MFFLANGTLPAARCSENSSSKYAAQQRGELGWIQPSNKVFFVPTNAFLLFLQIKMNLCSLGIPVSLIIYTQQHRYRRGELYVCVHKSLRVQKQGSTVKLFWDLSTFATCNNCPSKRHIFGSLRQLRAHARRVYHSAQKSSFHKNINFSTCLVCRMQCVSITFAWMEVSDKWLSCDI